VIAATKNLKHQTGALGKPYGAGFAPKRIISLKVGTSIAPRMTLRSSRARRQGSVSAHALPGEARAPAHVVAGGAGPGQDA